MPRPLALALGLMLFVSCTNPQWVCGCDPLLPGAVVYGQVSGPDGVASAGALVSAVWGEQCADPFHTMGEVQTGTDGRYRMLISVPGAHPPGSCLRALAAPPAQSTLRGSDTVAFTVQFTVGSTLDSVRVDLVLRAP